MMTLAQKMRIKEGTVITALHAPENYEQLLGALPADVVIRRKAAAKNGFIHLFVRNKADLEQYIFKAIAALEPGALIWISYPKGSSGIQTDLSRDKGWEVLAQINIERLTLISFDDQWSAFLMRNAAVKVEAVAALKKPKEVDFANPAAKTVVVPEDLQKAFKKEKEAKAYYESLAYSHRKEYVRWIMEAKRPETRERRVLQTIALLLQRKKNPSDK